MEGSGRSHIYSYLKRLTWKNSPPNILPVITKVYFTFIKCKAQNDISNYSPSDLYCNVRNDATKE